MRFSLPSIKCLVGPPSFRLLPNSVRHNDLITAIAQRDCDLITAIAQRFDYRALGSSQKLGGAGEHLIDCSEKRICRLSFEF